MKVLSLRVRVRSMSSMPAMGRPERQLKEVWLGLLYTGGRICGAGRIEKFLASFWEVDSRRNAGWIEVLISWDGYAGPTEEIWDA